jgi:hypothetical protein
VELVGLMPLGAVLDCAGAELTVAANGSILTEFVRHCCGLPRWQGLSVSQAVEHLFAAVQPSTRSELSGFLSATGQYLSLSRWAAVVALTAAPTITPSDALTTFAQHAARMTQLVAELLELLRLQGLSAKRAAKSSGPSALERAIAVKVRALISASTAISDRDGGSLLLPSAAASPVVPQRTTGETVQWGSAEGGLLVQARDIIATAELDSNLHPAQLRTKVDGILALVAALRPDRRGTNNAHLLSKFQTEPTAVVLKKSSGLWQLLGVVALQEVLEIVERSLTLLPVAFGAGLAQEGALLLASQVASILDATSARSSLVDAGALMTALHGAWSSVFEHALQQGDRYNEALAALIHMAEVEEQRAADKSGAVAGLSWREALRALVAQACNCGRLAWLCAIPEQQLQSVGSKGVCLGDAIAATFESLAATLDLPSSAERGVNYYECLMVFQLSRRNYREGARVMHALCKRSEQLPVSAETVQAETRSVEVLLLMCRNSYVSLL